MKKRKASTWRPRNLAAVLIAAALSAPPAMAANDAMVQLLKVLHDKGTIDAETYDMLKAAAKADDEQNAAGHTEIKAAASTLPKIETRGKLEVATHDGDFSWRIGGRTHLDGAVYGNDEGTNALGNPRRTAMAGGTDMRRARLELAANLWRVWNLRLQYEFTGSGAGGIRDAWIRYLVKGSQPGYIQVGNFKEPFSLDELNSSNSDPFIEQALPNVFYLSRLIGIQGSTWGRTWTLTGGVFGDNIAPGANQPGCTGSGCTGNDTEGYSFTGRFTWSPIHSESSDRVLHFGLAGSWRRPDMGNVVRYAARPESFVARDALIDTGSIGRVEAIRRVGVEAAGNYGPLSLQGEYFYNGLERDGPNVRDVDFDGWYILGTYVLTGESRVYKFEEGVFDNPKPRRIVGKGGIGAWELAMRYSAVDLEDAEIATANCRVTPAATITCGSQSNFTFGVNWYPNTNLKFMANYVKVLDLDGGLFDGASPDIFQLRAQAYW
ncbi:MAG: OprO/OprP family phosphate-selective porin [Gammaproteobacteria bacterium]